MKIKKKHFTVVELIISMTVFSLILVITTQLFSVIQRSWIKFGSDTMVFENASLALELMTRDIQCIYYNDSLIPFWHKSQSDSNEFSNQSLNFIARTNFQQEGATTNLSEIKYQLYYTSDTKDSNCGWVMRSVTGDNSVDDKWNFISNLTVGLTGADNAFTANNDSSENYQKLIPYVTDLSFTCYDRDNIISSTTDAVVAFPFYIQLSMSIMDKDSWNKWINIGGQPDNLQSSGSVYDFRKKHERTFTKTVLIGDRGQYGW